MLARVIHWIFALALLIACAAPLQSTSSLPPSLAASFHCPGTKPDGSQPPGEKVISTQHHGNGALWTVLPPDGILTVKREGDGWLSTKKFVVDVKVGE